MKKIIAMALTLMVAIIPITANDQTADAYLNFRMFTSGSTTNVGYYVDNNSYRDQFELRIEVDGIPYNGAVQVSDLGNNRDLEELSNTVTTSISNGYYLTDRPIQIKIEGLSVNSKVEMLTDISAKSVMLENRLHDKYRFYSPRRESFNQAITLKSGANYYTTSIQRLSVRYQPFYLGLKWMGGEHLLLRPDVTIGIRRYYEDKREVILSDYEFFASGKTQGLTYQTGIEYITSDGEILVHEAD